MKKNSLFRFIVIFATILAISMACCLISWAEDDASQLPQVSAPSITKLTKSKTSATIKWAKVKGATRYQVYRSADNVEFVKVKTTKNTSWVNKKLKNDTTYFYKVRAYKISKGQKSYSQYSETLSIFIGKEINPKWEYLKNKYKDVPSSQNLIFVEYISGTRATIEVYDKEDGEWVRTLQCDGYVGKRGINKKVTGDRKTPTGEMNVTGAFGIKDKPETALDYLKVTKYHYWCGERKYYNKLIDTRVQKHKCKGEHLIDFRGAYDYGLFLDYNSNRVYGKGSAIFFHCSRGYTYTQGCIAVKTEDMLTILATIKDKTKVCVYPKYIY